MIPRSAPHRSLAAAAAAAARRRVAVPRRRWNSSNEPPHARGGTAQRGDAPNPHVGHSDPPPPAPRSTTPSPLPTAAERELTGAGGPAAAGPPTFPQRQFYSAFGVPIVKVFLGALVTYQALYLGWLKLEEWEERKGREGPSPRVPPAP